MFRLYLIDDKIANIIAGQFDIAFRFSKLVESNLIAKKIADSNFMLVASNDFVKQHGEPKTPQDLLALPAVIYTNGEDGRSSAYQWRAAWQHFPKPNDSC